MESKYKKASALLASLGIPIPEKYIQGNTDPAADKAEEERPAVTAEVKTVGGFIDLVELMRTAQTSFFESGGNRIYLQKARELEQKVDACIAARRGRKTQSELVKEGV